jgi:hypothetical protein
VAGLEFGFPYLLRRERKNAACKGEEHRQVRFLATAANGWREDATATRRIFHQQKSEARILLLSQTLPSFRQNSRTLKTTSVRDALKVLLKVAGSSQFFFFQAKL